MKRETNTKLLIYSLEHLYSAKSLEKIYFKSYLERYCFKYILPITLGDHIFYIHLH